MAFTLHSEDTVEVSRHCLFLSYRKEPIEVWFGFDYTSFGRVFLAKAPKRSKCLQVTSFQSPASDPQVSHH